MKVLMFNRAHDLDLLHDQLLTTLPLLRPKINLQGRLEAVMVVESIGGKIHLTIPDNVSEVDVGAVVAAHVLPLPIPDPAIAFLNATMPNQILILARMVGLKV